MNFPFISAALCSASLLFFNAYLWLKFPPSKRLDDRTTTTILAVDIGQLGSMLCLTGGLANPFAVLLIALVWKTTRRVAVPVN